IGITPAYSQSESGLVTGSGQPQQGMGARPSPKSGAGVVPTSVGLVLEWGGVNYRMTPERRFSFDAPPHESHLTSTQERRQWTGRSTGSS
ncbi:25256_t:CDS:2, partial [Racocetra persica]